MYIYNMRCVYIYIYIYIYILYIYIYIFLTKNTFAAGMTQEKHSHSFISIVVSLKK